MISKIPTRKPLNNRREGRASFFNSNTAFSLAIHDNRKISTLSVFIFVLSLLFFLPGCSGDEPKPNPQIHQKKYTVDELESKYRNIPKRPTEFNRDTDSISLQEQRFYTGLNATFNELEHYQKDISTADKIASKKEEKENKQRLVLEKRKEEAEKAKTSPEQKSGSIINAYYN